jgi:hypothetical protein
MNRFHIPKLLAVATQAADVARIFSITTTTKG